MKRFLPLLLVILLLAGCQRLYPDDYLSVETHRVYYAYRETTAATEPSTEAADPIRTVTHPSEIRSGIQDLINAGKTTGQFLLQDYNGDTDDLSRSVYDDLVTNSPKYVYAMEELKLHETETANGVLLNVELKPRMSAEQLQSISTRLYSNALPLIYNAVNENADSLIVQITVYKDTDYYKLLDDYILAHPDEVIETPEISVTVFPEETGSVRVVDFSFRYRTDRDTLKWQKKTVKSLLDSYQTQFQENDDLQSILDDLYRLLVPARVYKNTENANIYSLLLSKEGSSRTMASVSAYFCSHAGLNCEVVFGEREGEPWYWNRIQQSSGEPWLYFDLHAAALAGNPPTLLTAEEMTGYAWDRDAYPEIPSPEPTEPEEPQETEATEEETEANSGTP